MKRYRRISRRTVLRGLGTSLALPILDVMDDRGARRRTPAPAESRPCAWRSCTFPTACTCRTGRREAEGKDFDLPAILEPLKRRQGRPPGPQRADAESGAALGDGGGRPRSRHGQLPDGPSPAEDRRGRPPRGGLGRSGRRTANRGISPVFRLSRSAARAGRTPASATTAIAVRTSQTWRGEANRRRSPSRSIPGWCSTGSSAARPRVTAQKPAPGRDRRQKSVLDFVAEDARRLTQDLGASDRRKLDEYLTGVREVERRISRTPGRRWTWAGRPAHATAGNSRRHRRTPAGDERSAGARLPDRPDAESRRSSSPTTAATGATPRSAFPTAITTSRTTAATPAKQARIRTINRFHVAQLAYLLEQAEVDAATETDRCSIIR